MDFVDKGGWINGDVVKWFVDFMEIIMGCIGDCMYFVVLINEFWCVSWLSYFFGYYVSGC